MLKEENTSRPQITAKDNSLATNRAIEWNWKEQKTFEQCVKNLTDSGFESCREHGYLSL